MAPTGGPRPVHETRPSGRASGAAPSGPPRIRSLDGLRGVAALIVVLYHLSLIARPYLDSGTTGDAWWWIDSTPLKLATAGSEAVLVFFVLSGMVVSLPMLRSDRASWPQYYARRLARLYLPVWAALVLAVALVLIIPRDPSSAAGGSWLGTTNALTTSLSTFVHNASLTDVGSSLDNPLWSLRWELGFSLALPACIAIAWMLRRWWLIGIAGALALSLTGRIVSSDALLYLPLFVAGTLLAAHLQEAVDWCKSRGRTFRILVPIVSATLLIGSNIVRPFEPPSTLFATIVWGLSGFGAFGLVISAMASTWLRRVLESRIPQHLGRISFSLYLVHVPIIATLGFVFGDWNWWLVAIVGIPLSLLVAEGFNRLIERPSQKLRLPRVRVDDRTGLIRRGPFSGAPLPQ